MRKKFLAPVFALEKFRSYRLAHRSLFTLITLW